MADYTSHEAPAQEAAALPVQLPQKLVGRDAVIARIYTHLRENKPFLIYGAPGIGKTALAATLAAAYTEQPGGVLWMNVDNASLEQLIVRVGRAYGVREISISENPQSMIGAAASTLTSHKPLIVLDGTLNEVTVQAFINRCADKLPVLLVNQQPFAGENWTSEQLEALEAGHAAALFKQVAAMPEAPDADVDALVEMLGNNPMAITLAAASARAIKQTPAQYRTTLTQIPGYQQAAPSLLALTAAFRSQNSALQGLILMLGATFKGEASAELLSKVGNAPQETIEQVMRMLAAQHLIESVPRYGLAYYRLHSLTHKFAQTLAGEQRLKDLQVKLRDALIDYANQYGGQASDSAYQHMALMMDNFLAVSEWAADDNDTSVASQLVQAMTYAGDFVHECGYVYELLRLRGMASMSTTAFPASAGFEQQDLSFLEGDDEEDEEDAFDFDDELEDEEEDDFDEDFDEEDDFDFDDELEAEDEEDDVFDLDDDEEDEDEDDDFAGAFIPEVPDEDEDAVTAAQVSEVDRLRMTLAQAKSSGDRERQIELLKAMAQAQVDQGQQNEAIVSYSEMIALYDDDDEDEDLLEALDSLSTLLVKTDSAQAAILHATRGIKLAQSLGDDDTRMHMYITLGDARQDLGESAAADTAYTQALTIARQRGDAQNEAIILYKLGYAKLDNSDAEGASATWEQALSLFRTQEKADYEGKVLGGLGTAYGDQGRWQEAMRFHTSALHIARAVGDKQEEADHLVNLAYACVQAEDLGQAVLRYRQALHLAYEGDDKSLVVSTIVELAGLLSRSPAHLSIAKLLLDEASIFEPNDRDVINLREKVNTALTTASVAQKPVAGSAYDYAANAYQLLEN